MMLNDGAVFATRSDIRFRVVGEEAVVVRQDSAEVIALNDVGASVLELLDSRRSFSQIIESLLLEYDVDRESLVRDVARFLSDLRDAGVVEELK